MKKHFSRVLAMVLVLVTLVATFAVPASAAGSYPMSCSIYYKRFCSQNIRKVKNDRIDAIHIASYGLTYWHELIPIQSSEDTYRELLLLSRQNHNVIILLIKAKRILETCLIKSCRVLLLSSEAIEALN